jgi:hypothetical protein
MRPVIFVIFVSSWLETYLFSWTRLQWRAMQTISLPAPARTSGPSVTRARVRRSRFYVGVSLLMTAIVAVGFWPTYFGPLLRGVTDRPWVIQLHGVVFVGWMVLLLAQVTLAARGRVSAHRKLGTFGIAYGCLVLVMGLVVSFAAPLIHLRNGEWDMNRAAGFLIIPLGDMVLFGGFFAAAIAYRRKSEIHKRLIVLATIALLFAAAGRMPLAQPVALVVWLSPLLVAMAYEAGARRRVHPVYLAGLGILLVGMSRVAFTESEGWLRIGRAALGALM